MIHELDNIPSSNYKGTQRNSIRWKVFIKGAGQVSYLSKERKDYFRPGHLLFEGKGIVRILSCRLPLLPLEDGEGLTGRLSHWC